MHHIVNGIHFEMTTEEADAFLANQASMSVLSDEELAKEADKTITAMIDSRARDLRWVDMKSARAAAGVPLSGSETDTELMIHAQAVALAQWDRKCWGKSLELEYAFKTGQIPRPTLEQIMAAMPVFTWPEV